MFKIIYLFYLLCKFKFEIKKYIKIVFAINLIVLYYLTIHTLNTVMDLLYKL